MFFGVKIIILSRQQNGGNRGSLHFSQPNDNNEGLNRYNCGWTVFQTSITGRRCLKEVKTSPKGGGWEQVEGNLGVQHVGTSVTEEDMSGGE